ncbi:MAG: hypothetical protein ACK528_05830 [Alphaproteobacteria bacterium]|jgi:hypothetical protein
MKSETNTIPINLQASKLLWKSPWWAKAPPEEKKVVEKAIEPLTIDAAIDYMKEPPQRPGPKENQVKDLRGCCLIWGNGMKGIIVGFADAKISVTTKKMPDGRKLSRERRTFFWWVIREDGEFKRVKGNNDGRKEWSFIPANSVIE